MTSNLSIAAVDPSHADAGLASRNWTEEPIASLVRLGTEDCADSRESKLITYYENIVQRAFGDLPHWSGGWSQ